MTTAAPPRSTARTSAAPGHPLVGTGALVRLALRRDRVRLPVWVLSTGLLTVYSVFALRLAYPDAASRQGRAALMENPAAVMLGGPGFGVDDYTVGAMVANELGLTVMVVASIMSVLLVVRHTRADEEQGRAELVRAGVVGRHAPLAAALAVTALADLGLGVVVAGGLAAADLGAVDSVAFALGVALTGLLLGPVAAVTAQVAAHARPATGSALAVLAAAAVVRGVGDVLHPTGSALSWCSPIAWAQQTRVYVDLRWWPLLLTVLGTVALVALAFGLVDRRDVGAGLVAARGGRATASPRLAGPAGLLVRLQRGSLAGWAVGVALTGATFGALTDSVLDAVQTNPAMEGFLQAGGGSDLLDSFFATLMVYIALGAAGFAVGSVLRLRSQEQEGRVELLLAAAVARPRLALVALGVALGGAVLVLVAGGAAMGVTAAGVQDDPAVVGRLVLAALVHLPAVALLAAAALALVGAAPRWAVLAWVPVGWAVLVGLFAGLLDLPDAALWWSPLHWVPRYPAEAVDPVPLLVLSALAVALAVVGVVGYRRRDVPA
ncbi:ABC transporter [Angustibacter speluncae]